MAITYVTERTSLSDIARMISDDWTNVYFGAVPYLNAMHALDSVNEAYGCDSGKSIVRYFLSNASTWRGEVARQVKAELRKRVA